MKIIKKTILEWDEFRDRLDDTPFTSDIEKLNSYSSNEETKSDEWYGTKSWIEAIFLLDAGGWGIDRLEKIEREERQE